MHIIIFQISTAVTQRLPKGKVHKSGVFCVDYEVGENWVGLS